VTTPSFVPHEDANDLFLPSGPLPLLLLSQNVMVMVDHVDRVDRRDQVGRRVVRRVVRRVRNVDGSRGLQHPQGELHNVVHGHKDEHCADEGNESLANQMRSRCSTHTTRPRQRKVGDGGREEWVLHCL